MARRLAIDQRPAATQATWSPVPSPRNAVSEHAVTAAQVIPHQLASEVALRAVLAVAESANGRSPGRLGLEPLVGPLQAGGRLVVDVEHYTSPPPGFASPCPNRGICAPRAPQL